MKEYKIALRPILRYVKDGKLHARLMGLFMAIKALDRKSAAGDLNVSEGLRTLKGKMLLREFVFTPKASIRSQFGNPEINEDDFTLIWKNFASSPTRFPKIATHFELQYLVLSYKSENNLFITYTAAPVRRSRKDGLEQLELRTEKTIVKEEGVQYILALGLRFMEIIGGEEYPLLGQNTVGVEILGVFE